MPDTHQHHLRHLKGRHVGWMLPSRAQLHESMVWLFGIGSTQNTDSLHAAGQYNQTQREGSPAGKAAPSSLRRMLKWRSAWLLFQAALLMGRSTSTLERYTTLAATTSFVAACMPQLTLELRVVWHAHWGHPKRLLHVMRAAGSVRLLFEAASLVWRSTSIWTVKPRWLPRPRLWPPACHSKEYSDAFLAIVKGSRSMDHSQSSSCALSGMRVGATDKRLHHAMHAPGSAWISPQSTGNCQQGPAKHMAIWTSVEGAADLVR